MIPRSTPIHLTLSLPDADATAALGARLATLLRPGDMVALEGTLGAGKTHLARALIQARQIAAGGVAEDVPSPSYTLVQTYAAGPTDVWHADLYRLTSPEDLTELGLEDALAAGAICLVEWPDRMGPHLPERRITLRLVPDPADLDARRAELSLPADRADLAHALAPDQPSGGQGSPIILTSPATAPTPPSDRAALSQEFIRAAGWDNAERAFLAGDASNRRYDRLRRGAETAVLMDAPPEKGEDVAPFLAIAAHLRNLDLSAPAPYAEDRTQGFLLLEDLGDDVFARVLEKRPQDEGTLYAAATDVLVHLARTAPPPGLGLWGPAQMGAAAALAVIWYRSAALGVPTAQADDPAALALAADVEAAVTNLCPPPSVLVLRDYHAENLLWLPNRVGLARVGLLDFQSAQLGPPGYDLISMLQDARRDVGAATATDMRARFAQATGQSVADTEGGLAALGAQRALRILGTFARLCLRDGKPSYLRLVPRVWGQLQENLNHPALSGLRVAIAPLLPPPSPETLARIAARCTPSPTA